MYRDTLIVREELILDSIHRKIHPNRVSCEFFLERVCSRFFALEKAHGIARRSTIFSSSGFLHFFSRRRNALFGVEIRGGGRCTSGARRSLIFYDCLKCSASHNFAFADSNSRCVLSWRLRTSTASLASASWFLPRSFELARGGFRNPSHRFDCLFPPLDSFIPLFLFILCLLCVLLK